MTDHHLQPTPRLRIVIIGGGLAGSTLANALVQLRHIDVPVYESAPQFSERGASVVLSANAIQALKRAVPSSKELLENAGAVRLHSSKVCLGSGPEAGTIILDMSMNPNPDPESNGVAVHRASLLRELLVPLPNEVLHIKKKLTSLSETHDGVSATFADGAVEQFDPVIGADGIFGVRNYVLQDKDNKYGPSPAEFWDSRALVPIEKARAIIGDKHFSADEVDCQHGWIGDGAFLLYDVLENGTMSQIIISAIENDPPRDQDERKRRLTREFLENTLNNWLDGPIAKSIIVLTLDQEDPQRYSEWEHKETPTYLNGRASIAGDAAHPMTPSALSTSQVKSSLGPKLT